MEDVNTNFVKNLFKKNGQSFGRFLMLLVLVLASIYTSRGNFLFFHSSIELFCVIIAFSLFFISGGTYGISNSTNFVFLGMAYGFIGIFMALHLLTYKGMAIFPGDTSGLTVQLRIAGVYIEGISLLIFVFLYNREINTKKYFCIYSICSILILLSIFYFDIFPVCFIPGSGYTTFKSISELLIISLLILSSLILMATRDWMNRIVFKYMMLSIAALIISELLFCFYKDIYNMANTLGHIFKLISFYYIYKSVMETNLNVPYRIINEVNSELKIKTRKLQSVNEELEQEISERKEAENELSIQKAYFEGLFEGSPEAIVMLSNSEMVVNANKGFEDLFGYDVDEIKGCFFNDLIVPDNLYDEATGYSTSVLSGSILQKEALRKRKDGSLVNVSILGYPIMFSNEQIGIYGIYNDITERKRTEEKIRFLSFHDKLTGLYNRAFFEEELKRLDTERQLPLTVIMGDLNNLKLANDIFGHEEGDNLLKSCADIFKACCREEDIIARWGGDEFVILLPTTLEDTASKICERIRKTCKEWESGPIQPSIALGIASKEDIGQSIQKVLNEAEHRMYRNKLVEQKSARHSVIASLERLLLEKNYENQEHAERIQQMSLKMGHALNLSNSQMDELSLLAMLHDIGKIAVPDEILLKPGKLTEEEWIIVKKHTEIGFRIAQSSSELSSIAYAILTHHEHWDGKGYPNGLHGEKIPFISRIISIIDAYEVMTHERPYMRTFTQEEAIEELRDKSGTQFDPDLVEVFINMLLKESFSILRHASNE